ncbi:unnamed protein product [Cladocopium goreaui]|uniref:Glucose-6-phosphate 1-epimerase n=1 Tax=Cladocopium goreaui TaxID=2562237 RepID=A0A9P1D5T2_9DINO|nr:unnamed protein product [Cladocopium goreaui]
MTESAEEALRKSRESRFHNMSKSSGDSNFIQIQIPLDCYAGDAFVVEVDDAAFQIVVPAGCSHGEVIYMDMREAMRFDDEKDGDTGTARGIFSQPYKDNA